jgi:polyisoprenoid-binding protein YceI
LSEIDFRNDGTYTANVIGTLTLHGVTNNISETLKLIVKEGTISGMTEFNITLADYGVVFEKGKPSTNIGKNVKITAHLNYKQ